MEHFYLASMAGAGGQNSCLLSRAWVLTKFCENLIDTYR
jgi:hypothetical protein